MLVKDIFRSYETKKYSVYKLNHSIPEYYGFFYLEDSTSSNASHTVCNGRLQRYFDKNKSTYLILSDATCWDDGGFQLQYCTYVNIIYFDKIINNKVSEFKGVYCCSADEIRSGNTPLWSSELNYVFDYNYGIFDLNSNEKFIDMTETDEYDFIDEINLNNLIKYTDIDEIKKKVKEYYKMSNNNILPYSSNISNDTTTSVFHGEYTISCLEDIECLSKINNIKKVALIAQNDDPNYFSFLYSYDSIKFIRFDISVSNEQILNILENMPNVEAVVFGFSEV